MAASSIRRARVSDSSSSGRARRVRPRRPRIEPSMPVATARACRVASAESMTCRQRATARSQSPVWRRTAVRQARQSWAVGSMALAAQNPAASS